MSDVAPGAVGRVAAAVAVAVASMRAVPAIGMPKTSIAALLAFAIGVYLVGPGRRSLTLPSCRRSGSSPAAVCSSSSRGGCARGHRKARELAQRPRPARPAGASWMLFGGVLSIVLAALRRDLPSSAAWTIGLLAGINLVSWGTRAVVAASLLKRAFER